MDDKKILEELEAINAPVKFIKNGTVFFYTYIQKRNLNDKKKLNIINNDTNKKS
jgi:hypothetical protein